MTGPAQSVHLHSTLTFSDTRCHPEYAAGAIAHGGDGVEADPAPDRHSPWNLPAASRKPLHLEKRVFGRDGEVSWEGGRACFITFLISTWI